MDGHVLERAVLAVDPADELVHVRAQLLIAGHLVRVGVRVGVGVGVGVRVRDISPR